jgi:hypothetical protein
MGDDDRLPNANDIDRLVGHVNNGTLSKQQRVDILKVAKDLRNRSSVDNIEYIEGLVIALREAGNVVTIDKKDAAAMLELVEDQIKGVRKKVRAEILLLRKERETYAAMLRNLPNTHSHLSYNEKAGLVKSMALPVVTDLRIDPTCGVVHVDPCSAVDRACMFVGDRVLAVNNVVVHTDEDYNRIVNDSSDGMVLLTWLQMDRNVASASVERSAHGPASYTPPTLDEEIEVEVMQRTRGLEKTAQGLRGSIHRQEENEYVVSFVFIPSYAKIMLKDLDTVLSTDMYHMKNPAKGTSGTLYAQDANKHLVLLAQVT